MVRGKLITMRAPELISVLGVLCTVVLGCGGDAQGTGVTVSGKLAVGANSRTFTTLMDDGGVNQVGCTVSDAASGPVMVAASLLETDVGWAYHLTLSFDKDSLAVADVSLSLGQGTENTGDDCSATVTSLNGSAFSASITCATSNGGSGPMLSLQVDYVFCQVTAAP
jgi:hypothetical protein